MIGGGVPSMDGKSAPLAGQKQSFWPRSRPSLRVVVFMPVEALRATAAQWLLLRRSKRDGYYHRNGLIRLDLLQNTTQVLEWEGCHVFSASTPALLRSHRM
jgi:hypothetical protein